jgi:hypothetical protein
MEISGRYNGAGNEDMDNKYRFGFGGQEKDDEITGQTGSVYTAMFWEYDARIGRRWNLDPVIKPWMSSYCTFSNNPIARIDPLGDDDYFSSTGKFLYRTNNGTDFIRIIPNGKVNELVAKYHEDVVSFRSIIIIIPKNVQGEFSQNSVLMSEYYWGQKPDEAMIALGKIGKFYSLFTEGFDGTERIIGQQANGSIMSSGLNDAFSKKHISISLMHTPENRSGHTQIELNNVGNFINVLVHEKVHYDSFKPNANGSYHYSGNPEWEDELPAYYAQMKSETWKNTTEDFQSSRIAYAKGYYNSITNEEDREYWKDQFSSIGISLE